MEGWQHLNLDTGAEGPWNNLDPGELLTAREFVLEMFRRPDWWDHAACLGVGPDVFFPPRGKSLDRAAALCRQCPSREQCLTEALALDPFDDQGFRAGYTAQERQSLRQGAA